jgi:hypothetical protein
VNIENAPKSKNLNVAIARTGVFAIGTFLFCAIAVVYFYVCKMDEHSIPSGIIPRN